MFNGITDAGKKYLAKCQATNKPVTFSSIKLGNGIIDDLENPEQFTDLKSLKKEVSITNKEQIEDAVRLTLEFSNEGIIEGFFLKEFGVYVQDDEQEILYWYINDAMEANWLPPAERAPVKYKYYLNILATNLDSLIVNWAGNEFFVTKEFLEQELAKKLNKGNLPEKITDAKTLFDIIENNGGLSIDTNLLYLNNEGTKIQDKLYFDRLTKGLFRCIKTTTSTVNSNDLFENISNNKIKISEKFKNDIFNLTQNIFQSRCTHFPAVKVTNTAPTTNWNKYTTEIHTVNNTRYYRPGLEFLYKVTKQEQSYRLEIKDIKFNFKEDWRKIFEPNFEIGFTSFETDSKEYLIDILDDGSANQNIDEIIEITNTVITTTPTFNFDLVLKYEGFTDFDFPNKK